MDERKAGNRRHEFIAGGRIPADTPRGLVGTNYSMIEAAFAKTTGWLFKQPEQHNVIIIQEQQSLNNFCHHPEAFA